MRENEARKSEEGEKKGETISPGKQESWRNKREGRRSEGAASLRGLKGGRGMEKGGGRQRRKESKMLHCLRGVRQ